MVENCPLQALNPGRRARCLWIHVSLDENRTAARVGVAHPVGRQRAQGLVVNAGQTVHGGINLGNYFQCRVVENISVAHLDHKYQAVRSSDAPTEFVIEPEIPMIGWKKNQRSARPSGW